MKTFTVFCQQADGIGTIWIQAVDAADLDEAKKVGRDACAIDWCCGVDEVCVLGVAEGDVHILYWIENE